MRDTGLASKRQYPAVLPASAECGAASVGTKNTTMLHLAYKAYSKDGEHCISWVNYPVINLVPHAYPQNPQHPPDFLLLFFLLFVLTNVTWDRVSQGVQTAAHHGVLCSTQSQIIYTYIHTRKVKTLILTVRYTTHCEFTLWQASQSTETHVALFQKRMDTRGLAHKPIRNARPSVIENDVACHFNPNMMKTTKKLSEWFIKLAQIVTWPVRIPTILISKPPKQVPR